MIQEQSILRLLLSESLLCIRSVLFTLNYVSTKQYCIYSVTFRLRCAFIYLFIYFWLN